MEPYEAEQKPSILKPVIIGGIVGGILGVIPMISSLNCCCCMWFALGGVIAVLIYRTTVPYGFSAGMGALLGLVSGLVSGIITGVGQYVIQMQTWAAHPEMFDPTSDFNSDLIDRFKEAGCVQEQIDQYISMITNVNEANLVSWALSMSALFLVVGTIISVIAGIITAAIAGKPNQHVDEPPPYQP